MSFPGPKWHSVATKWKLVLLEEAVRQRLIVSFRCLNHEGEASSNHSFKCKHWEDPHQHHVDVGFKLPSPTFTRRQLGHFSQRERESVYVEGLEPHSLTVSRPVGGLGGSKRAKVVRIKRYCPGIRPLPPLPRPTGWLASAQTPVYTRCRAGEPEAEARRSNPCIACTETKSVKNL